MGLLNVLDVAALRVWDDGDTDGSKVSSVLRMSCSRCAAAWYCTLVIVCGTCTASVGRGGMGRSDGLFAILGTRSYVSMVVCRRDLYPSSGYA